MKNIVKLTVIMLLIGVMTLTGCSAKTKIDLKEYVNLNVSGADGYGVICAETDIERLLECIQTGENDEEGLVAALSTLGLLEEISYQADKTEGLSNGDEVTISVTYPETLSKHLDVNLAPKSGSSWTIEVSGLKPPEKVDLFENISLEYNIGSTLFVKGGYSYLNYTLSKTQDLSNGDVVTITVSAPNGEENLADYCMKNYGWMPLSASCEYTVTGLDEYPVKYEEIPVDLFKEIRTIAETHIDEMGDQMHTNFGNQGYRLNSYMLDSVYVLTPGENIDDEAKNEVYLMYRINADNPDGTFDYYYYAKFINLKINSEGQTSYDLHMIDYPYGDYGFDFYGEHYFCTGTEGEGFIGFKTKQNFYDLNLAEWEDTWVINSHAFEE